MKGRIIAKENGITMRSRRYRNEVEKFTFLEMFEKENNAYEIQITEDDEPEPKPIPLNQERQSIFNWFGSITLGIADNITLARFGIRAMNTDYIHVRTIWEEMGRPRHFKLQNAQNYISKHKSQTI